MDAPEGTSIDFYVRAADAHVRGAPWIFVASAPVDPSPAPLDGWVDECGIEYVDYLELRALFRVRSAGDTPVLRALALRWDCRCAYWQLDCRG